MAVSFVAAGTVAKASGATVTPGLPSGWAADDIHLALITEETGAVIGVPSGWTKIIENTNTELLSPVFRMTLAWRRAVAGDTAPGFTGASGGIVARIGGFRGVVTTGNPHDTAPVVKDNTQSTTLTADALVPANADDMIIFLGSVEELLSDVTFSTYSGTNPTFTESFQDSNSIGGNFTAQFMAHGLKNDTSSTGSRTAALSTNSYSIGALISLQAAGGGGDTLMGQACL